jgi:hypothetical protein
LAAFTGRARTISRAGGLALKVIALPVKGLTPAGVKKTRQNTKLEPVLIPSEPEKL